MGQKSSKHIPNKDKKKLNKSAEKEPKNNNDDFNSSNNINNNNIINGQPILTEKTCPNCKLMFKYTTQYYINLYNQHVRRCRPYSSTLTYNYNPNISSSRNLPIRVNAYNQGLNNVLGAFGVEAKKILPRGKKDGTFEEKVDYLRYDI